MLRLACLLGLMALSVAVGSCGDGDRLPDATLGASVAAGGCGDGETDPGEQCDDGNLAGGDGCSAQCTRESSDTGGAVSPAATGGSLDAGSAGPAVDASTPSIDAASGTPDAAALDAGGADAASAAPDATASGDAGGQSVEPPALCPAAPGDTCGDCSCMQCKTELDACSNLAGTAGEGPAQGKAKAALCAALVNCGRSTGCRGLTCICDPANTSSCLSGTTPPDGPCKDQVLAAAETTDMAMFLTRATMLDMGYAVAVASAVSTCSANSCADACAQP